MTADPEAPCKQFSQQLLVPTALIERRYRGSDSGRELEIPARDAA